MEYKKEAESLAAQLAWGQPRQELTARISALDCPGELKAGLLLVNGELDASHRVSQRLSSALGCHWHALMHRHEPDLANSKYWQGRVGASPIYPDLVQAAKGHGMAQRVAPEDVWDALAFTDLYANAAQEPWSLELDVLEIETLLRHTLATV